MDDDVFIVTDDLIGQGKHSVRLHWLIPDYPLEPQAKEADTAFKTMMADRIPESQQKTSGGWRFRTPAGDFSLRVFSNRDSQWNIYRVGELAFGPAEEKSPVPSEVRGWRSLRYASKSSALSLVGIAEGELPIRFISVWTPLPRGK
jgi:hypothetical protein